MDNLAALARYFNVTLDYLVTGQEPPAPPTIYHTLSLHDALPIFHEAVKGEDGSREQEVEIFYRFIGKID